MIGVKGEYGIGTGTLFFCVAFTHETYSAVGVDAQHGAGKYSGTQFAGRNDCTWIGRNP